MKVFSDIAKDALDLPAAQRRTLARILLDLSETATESPEQLQTAWEDEISRRLRELRSGAVKGVPLDAVKRKIEAGFQP